MARVGFFSDAQLGAGASIGAPGARLAEQQELLLEVAETFAEHAVDIACFLGDAFQHRRPSIAELVTWQRALAAFECDVLCITGNHDWQGANVPHALELSAGIAQVHPRPFLQRRLYGHEDIAFGLLPWAPVTSLAAARGDVPRELVNENVAERLLAIAQGLAAEAEGYPVRILLAHWMLSGTAMPSGLPVSEAREPILLTPALVAQGWDLVMGGHVHLPQIVGTARLDSHGAEPKVAVCGSPYICDFGEAASDHGCWIYDTEHRALTFHPMSDRRFITLNLTATEANDVLRWDAADGLDGAVVRVKVYAQEGEQVDVVHLRHSLLTAGVYHVHGIDVEHEQRTRARVEGVDESLPPLDALDQFIEAHDIPAGEAESMRVRTTTYLEAVR